MYLLNTEMYKQGHIAHGRFKHICIMYLFNQLYIFMLIFNTLIRKMYVRHGSGDPAY